MCDNKTQNQVAFPQEPIFVLERIQFKSPSAFLRSISEEMSSFYEARHFLTSLIINFSTLFFSTQDPQNKLCCAWLFHFNRDGLRFLQDSTEGNKMLRSSSYFIKSVEVFSRISRAVGAPSQQNKLATKNRNVYLRACVTQTRTGCFKNLEPTKIMSNRCGLWFVIFVQKLQLVWSALKNSSSRPGEIILCSLRAPSPLLFYLSAFVI